MPTEPRLPFDSGRMTGRPPPASGGRPGAPRPAEPPLSVTQLAAMIDHALRDRLPMGLKVLGEISRFTDRTHWYFDLKDAGAVIACVMWQSAARRMGFTPSHGQQVVLTGRVEYYQPFGKTQFMVEKLEPVGAGALDLAYRRLLEDLRALGYFAPERKRPLPMLPRKIAVVTSRTGAALQDVLDTVGRRCPSLPLALADVRVQGEGAAPQVASAIRSLGRHHVRWGIDVILVTRGGGSLEDLWAFNERIVADAIYESPIPVVAAIGHETDTTIAELVADLRCATPTQAAMRIAPDSEALRRQLFSLGGRLGSILTRQIRLDSERLRAASRHAFFATPDGFIQQPAQRLRAAAQSLRHAALERLQQASRRLDLAGQRLNRHRPEAAYARRESDLAHVAHRLRAAAASAVSDRTATLESAARSLDLIGPHNVLRRGYSVTHRSDGSVLRSVEDARAGEALRTHLADGSITSIVAPEGEDRDPLHDKSPARKSRSRSVDRDQMGLF
ncbi:MAG TPA: exodeoxyribonuclease VII large subunit [Phycisphaerales bacterium]|nr:exodeoxyribonuclease VII large subunit [Phycisphaerales bacterium]